MMEETSPEENSEHMLGGGNTGQLERLLDLLEKLWMRRNQEFAERWQRSLPFADYIVDRWKKARLLGFGEGSSIYDSALVIGDVKVGRNTWIGPQTVLDGSGGLTIGDYCSISAGVQIYSHDTVRWAISGGKAEPERAPTRIGSQCYIGPNCVISKGISIGDGSIVGAGSIVKEDIPPHSKAFGTPCRVVGKVA